ncbi:O-antigen ligase family protein [Flavobacteriaceae bacterium XHP0103]|nr:O-antigen ligase family protein [Marixanthotalea marina]
MIIYHLVFSYFLLNSYDFRFEKIIKDYLDIVMVICFVAVFQYVSYFIRFSYGADFSYLGFDMGNLNPKTIRVQAWFQEPSFLAYSIMPAVFISLGKIFKISDFISYKKAIAVLIVLLLSFSSIGYLGLIISLLIIIFNKYSIIKKPRIMLVLVLVFIFSSIFFYNIPDIKLRVDDTYQLFMDESITKKDIDSKNLSTYAIYSNFRVTKEVASRNLFFGTGLGTYEDNYNKHINEVIPSSTLRDNYSLNKKDANSLFLRLLSEVGLFVLSLVLSFLFLNKISYSKVSDKNKIIWLFNNGIFVLILLRLIRQGHYTMLGFLFFTLIFYYTHKFYVKRVS